MSVWGAKQALKQAQRNLDSANKRHADAAKKQSKLENEIGKLEGKASKSRSESQIQNYLRQVETRRGQLSRARDDVAKRLDDATKAKEKVGKAEEKLRSEEEAEQKREKRAQDQKKRQNEQRQRQTERSEANQRRREEQAQRATEAERDRREAEQDHKITELERGLEEANREKAPPEVAVLFLASSPEDQVALRLDKETREIEKRVRSSDYRDSIYFRPRMARQLTDLLDDLNEMRPTILHFSGHGSGSGLAFEDEDGSTQALDNAVLDRLLNAAAGGVQLILFNSCDSASQAEVVSSTLTWQLAWIRPSTMKMPRSLRVSSTTLWALAVRWPRLSVKPSSRSNLAEGMGRCRGCSVVTALTPRSLSWSIRTQRTEAHRSRAVGA